MTHQIESRLLYAKHFRQSGLWTKLTRRGLAFDRIITAEDRHDACLYGTDSTAPWRALAVQRPNTRVILNPESPSERDLYLQLLPGADFNIAWGLDPDRVSRHRWTAELGKDNIFTEGQCCLLVAECGPDVTGFSRFSVQIFRNPEAEEKTTRFSLHVDLVYVRPPDRGSGFGLDLSIAASRICCDVFAALLRASPVGESIEVCVFADFESEGGDRFVTYIIEQLEAAVELAQMCSGLMYPDTDLGENARHGEVFDEQAETYVFPGVQTAGGMPGAGSRV